MLTSFSYTSGAAAAPGVGQATMFRDGRRRVWWIPFVFLKLLGL